MPEIIADSVDAFVFRKSGARVQFLLLQRESGRSFASVWQSMHTRIEQRETPLSAARRAVRDSIGVDPLSAYSIDYIGQIFDHERDLIVLSPSIAFSLPPGAEYTLGDGLPGSTRTMPPIASSGPISVKRSADSPPWCSKVATTSNSTESVEHLFY